MNNIFPLIYSIFVTTRALAGTQHSIQNNPIKTALDLVSANKINAIVETISCYSKQYFITTDIKNGSHELWDDLVANVEIIIDNIFTKEYNMSEECEKLGTILCDNAEKKDSCFKDIKLCTADVYKRLFNISETNTRNIWKSMIESEKKLIRNAVEYFKNTWSLEGLIKNDLFEERKDYIIKNFKHIALKYFKQATVNESIDMEDIRKSLRLTLNSK
ncbi:uncharacterized protein LOC126896841 [Daktulosphaira vitifoliae]|uniref:uncharacterized protein LOC126896841 n=1 Tax=Daktulosphaira vitifoliae TaxID=58002 RepID=UPI0021A9FD6C|nr:uncharacterized protein LOC126896841 [Daktulosphaira vitifoliae]